MNAMTDSASPTVAEAFPLVKTCTKCGVEKLLVEFSPHQRGKFGRSSWCKGCNRAYQRSHNQIHGVKLGILAYKQGPVAKAYRRAYKQRRRLADPLFRLTSSLRTRLQLALKGRSKSARTLDLIGCDTDFLRRWLEAKFLPGMTWENYGEWHIDHIMPCASFDLSDPVQQRTCFRWTNLQPLWAADNIRKSDNYAP